MLPQVATDVGARARPDPVPRGAGRTEWRPAACGRPVPARRWSRDSRSSAGHGRAVTRCIALLRLAVAQHLHGGVGFDVDYGLARYYPLSKQIELTLGGANAQLGPAGCTPRGLM